MPFRPLPTVKVREITVAFSFQMQAFFFYSHISFFTRFFFKSFFQTFNCWYDYVLREILKTFFSEKRPAPNFQSWMNHQEFSFTLTFLTINTRTNSYFSVENVPKNSRSSRINALRFSNRIKLQIYKKWFPKWNE